MEPDIRNITLHFPQGRKTTVVELVGWEPADPDVGIFGDYIEVMDSDDDTWILDSMNHWIHPMKTEDEADWSVICGTFSGELFPEPSLPKITARLILICCQEQLNDESEERLDVSFGIGLDTELEVS